MKRVMSLLLVLVFCVGILAGCGSSKNSSTSNKSNEVASDVIAPDWKGATFTLGTLNPEINPDSKSAKWFADKLYEKTNGRLVINVFPNSQLGKQTTQIEALTMGTQDFFIGGMEPFESIAKEFRAMNVFFMFKSQEQFQKFFGTEYFKSAEKSLAEKNILCINKSFNWVKGPFRILMSSKPFDETLKSISGMRVRVPNLETFQKSYTALGCVPVVVSLSEAYLALQQGLVDAIDLIPASIKSNGFQEVAPYIMKTDAFPQREGVMMSKSAMESLPNEIQQLIYETADEAGEYYSQLVKKVSDDTLAEIQKEGVVYIDDADLSEWYEATANLGYDLEKSGYLPVGITDAIKNIQ